MEPSLFVAAVLIVAGVLALEFGISSAITEIAAGVLLALFVDAYRLTFGIITATVGLQDGALDGRLFSTVLLVVHASAALPVALLRDLPAELDR